jgi:peptidyl-tRNA hydrolase, PTH1 family
MKLIIGLGNPGNEYRFTRHNIGFLVLERWADHRGLIFQKESDYDFIRWKNNLVIKPTTYMNCSGQAIQRLLQKYRTIEDILVIADDVYLPFGEIRIREKGGDGGHNGIKSIIDVLNSQEFKRIRIGIQEPEGQKLRDYVLSEFSEEESKTLEKLLDEVAKLVDLFLSRDYKVMADIYSQNKKTYSGKSKAGIE